MGKEYQIPQFRELFDIRKELTYLPEKIPTIPLGVKGVILLEREEKRPLEETCIQYTFRDKLAPFHEWRKVLDRDQSGAPESGAFVYYFDNNGPTHVGQMVDDRYVISKWGRGGHVYKHLVNLVPLYYGDTVKFFKKP